MDLIDPLYRFIAQWHDVEPPALPGSRPPAHHDRADNRWLRRALDPRTTQDAVAEAADRLDCVSRVEEWGQRMEVAAQLSHVLVHGDIHEDQLLVVDRLVKEGGVAVVKLEGPEIELVKALTTKGIAVMGHFGLTPQSVHALGGNKVQARSEAAVGRLLDDARRIEAAGASSLVLEAVPTDAARQVTEALHIPTIGIGAGPHCDGQVLVSTEMLGLSAGPSPRFAKRYADLRGQVALAAKTFAEEVAQGEYPDHEHSYDWVIR